MDALVNLEARVEAYLGQLGLAAAFRPGGVCTVDAGDTAVLVTCFVQDGQTWCRIAAVVLDDTEPTLGLLLRLLQLNHDVLLGAFQLFEDRTLAFSATLHGHNLDADTFATTLRYVAWVASTQALELLDVAGGRTWSDACSEGSRC